MLDVPVGLWQLLIRLALLNGTAFQDQRDQRHAEDRPQTHRNQLVGRVALPCRCPV
jgi:hypothetical protein